jgi:hypothetical protein
MELVIGTSVGKHLEVDHTLGSYHCGAKYVNDFPASF